MAAITLRRTYVMAALLAALGFAACNVAWRFGSGNPLALAAERGGIGLIAVSPLLWRAWWDGRIRRLLADPFGRIAIVASGSTIPASATMFRWLTGPQAALVIAVIPAFLIVPAKIIARSAPGRALPAVLISVIAADLAAVSGGLGKPTGQAIFAGGIFFIGEMCSMLAAERARAKHDAAVIVSCGMLVATVGCVIPLFIIQPANMLATSGIFAALIVGIVGTAARVLRQFALPHLGSAVTYSTSQITAVGTAAGGVLLLNDQLEISAAVLGCCAAAASLFATVASKQSAAAGTLRLKRKTQSRRALLLEDREFVE